MAKLLNHALESDCVAASWRSVQVGGTVRERKQGLPVETLHRVTLNSAFEPLSTPSLYSHTQGFTIVKKWITTLERKNKSW